MNPVEILFHQDMVVLRARQSELLILPVHVRALKELKGPKEFSNYFMTEALINRPARKLFESWLRKDQGVWPRLFDVIHNKVVISTETSEKAQAQTT